MGVDIDTSRPIRGPAGRKALVQAIRSASDAGEPDWLEWKSKVQLAEKAWRGEIATHLIGFGNRDATRARRAAGGHAYLVLGAEPGEVHGVEFYDPADLEN